ncbi:YidH family protein [Falsibacillus pallidus]|uniref:YidH family protein n=1 Tax=Falsibacillus pallidus TaxID=493781 RepID=UPI003D96A392
MAQKGKERSLQKELEPTIDSRYIQQHLANERTYLAWIRTAIAVIGVGFLITNLHFSLKSSFTVAGDVIANMIGALSVIFGIFTILFSTISYFRKLKDINQQTFRASRIPVVILTILLIMVICIFAYYLFSITFN